MTMLKLSWDHLCETLEIAQSEDIYKNLISAYSEPHRAYHTLQHIRECLELLDWVNESGPIEDRNLIEAALWFHDVVYNPQQNDNELKSAEWARTALKASGLDEIKCAKIYRLILATEHPHSPESVAEQWMIDIDLAILGSDSARFVEYELQIRTEYNWVPLDEYRQKRRAVLNSFLAQPEIYSTALFRHRFEEQARANLRTACNG